MKSINKIFGFIIFQCLIFFIFSASAEQSARLIKPEHSIILNAGEARLIELSQSVKTAFVAEPNIASFQAPDDRKILLFGLAQGRTSLFALDDQGEVIYSLAINVGFDISGIKKILKQRYPDTALKLKLTAQGVVVRGIVRSAVQANEIVALIEGMIPPGVFNGADSAASTGSEGQESISVNSGTGVGGLNKGYVTNLLKVREPNQVNVRIRIAEVSKKVKDKFEFAWNLNRLGLTDISINDANPIFSTFTETITNAATTTVEKNTSALGMVDILAEESLLNVLAEPTLTAKSGETASFLAGGKLLIPTISSDGGASVEEKPYGVLLQVTPTIISGNRINLHVRPEISDISSANSVMVNGSLIPGIDIRTAETTVELASGQSFVLAGMLKSSVINYVSKVPFFGDLPLIGSLFRSQKFENSETELIIVATVYLVEPVEDELNLPTDQLRLATPYERFLFNDAIVAKEGYRAVKSTRGLGDFKF